MNPLIVSVLAISALAGCPKKPGIPGGPDVPGGGGVPNVPGGMPGSSDKVEPGGCGGYASMGDVGRKLNAFLEATVQLQKVSGDTVAVVRESCAIMGKELGMSEAALGGDTKAVCDSVIAAYKAALTVQGQAKLAIKAVIQPAVCKVNVEASAKAAAECEGSASANVTATCSGKCSGKCNGECAGKMGTGGNAGQCEGTCKGKCEGSCEGSADVNASAQCKASAEVKANAEVTCTEPKFEVTLDASAKLDKSKAEAAIRALKAGIPRMLSVRARVMPLQAAMQSWVKTAGDLASSGAGFANSFKDQALCITGQLAAVAKASTQIQANVSVSVEVSASASGSVGSN